MALPRLNSLPVSIPNSLFRVNEPAGLFEPFPHVSGGVVAEAANADGVSATFSRIARLSIVAGFIVEPALAIADYGAQDFTHPVVLGKRRVCCFHEDVRPKTLHNEIGTDAFAKPVDRLGRDEGKWECVEDATVVSQYAHSAGAEFCPERRISNVESSARRGPHDRRRFVGARRLSK